MAVDKETWSCDCASLGSPRCALPVCSDRLPAEEICLNEVEKSYNSFCFFVPERRDKLRQCFRVQLRLGLLPPCSTLPLRISILRPLLLALLCSPQCATPVSPTLRITTCEIQHLIIFPVFFAHCWLLKTALIQASIPCVHLSKIQV